jgi:phosphoribosylformimino-5-aminoimidazole carboxamide ribotide isomerase
MGSVVLSVDLRDGRLLSPDPGLAGLPALAAVERLHRPGLREAIVLDLARVGSGAGLDIELIAGLHAAFPGLELLAGGGVRDAGDLHALARAGAAGALVATALHTGVIGARELR